MKAKITWIRFCWEEGKRGETTTQNPKVTGGKKLDE
jgi:hypothetical protein